MADEMFSFTIDGLQVRAKKGQTILEAADEAGVYIPRLCWMKDLSPAGMCRVCTVIVNGRPQAACTQPAQPGIAVLNDTDELREWRKNIIEMLFVEGNHFCPLCEKSGNCELQAVAYRMGMDAPRYPYMFPVCTIDASHNEILLDLNRCIQCGRCERAALERDGKTVFGFVGRGLKRSLATNGGKLSETAIGVTDRAAEACPVGTIIKKRIGYSTPIGKRLYDQEAIGADIDSKKGTSE